MSVLNFNEADLQQNRRGTLSQAQVAQISKDHRRSALIGMALFFAFVMVSTILVFIGRNAQNLIVFGAGFGLTLINALMIGVMAREYIRMGSDIRAGTVDALSGRVERVLRRGRKSDRYLLRIDDEELDVSRDIFLCFKHEQPYRLYRTRLAKVLLSAEPVAEQAKRINRALTDYAV